MKPANGRSFTNEEMKIVTKEVALTRESRSEELQASLLEHKRLRLLLDEIEFRLTEEFGVIRNGANAWVDRKRIDGHYTPTSRGDSYTGPGSTRKSS